MRFLKEHNSHVFTLIYRCLQILSKKYLRCSARMMVVQLQKLLRMKLNIPGEKQVSFQCTEC